MLTYEGLKSRFNVKEVDEVSYWDSLMMIKFIVLYTVNWL